LHRKSLIFKLQKQSLDNKNLETTNTEHCKIMRRLELDIRHGTAQRAVEFNSTLGRYGLGYQSQKIGIYIDTIHFRLARRVLTVL